MQPRTGRDRCTAGEPRRPSAQIAPARSPTRSASGGDRMNGPIQGLCARLVIVAGAAFVAGAAQAGQDWELVSITRGAGWEGNQAKGPLKQSGQVLEGVLKDKTDGKADYQIRVGLDGGRA